MAEQVPTGRGDRSLVQVWCMSLLAALVVNTLAATCVVVSACHSIPPAPRWTGPLGSWIDVGFERKRLLELDSMNVFSKDEFAAEQKTLLDKEAIIIPSFPDDRGDFNATWERVVQEARDSEVATLWTALAYWIISGTVTLAVTILCWRHDRAVAVELRFRHIAPEERLAK